MAAWELGLRLTGGSTEIWGSAYGVEAEDATWNIEEIQLD